METLAVRKQVAKVTKIKQECTNGNKNDYDLCSRNKTTYIKKTTCRNNGDEDTKENYTEDFDG